MVARYFIILCAVSWTAVAAIASTQQRSVVVVGGGVGGVVTAGLLAASPDKPEVLLLEKGSRLGGRMQSDVVQSATHPGHTYRFDTGPSLLLMPDIYRQTFGALGGDLADHVDLVPVEGPQYRVFFQGDVGGAMSEAIDISRDDAVMRQSLETLVPGEGDSLLRKYKKYLRIASDFLAFGFGAVIAERPDFSTLPAFLMACLRVWPLQSHLSMLRGIFGSDDRYKRVHALFSFQDLYIGLAPQETPAVFSLLQALEFEKGIYYPRGGFGQVARGLADLARQRGVQVRLGTECLGLQMSSMGPGGRVEGVHVGSSSSSGGGVGSAATSILCNAVVVNIDAPRAEELFLPPAVQDRGAITKRPSCGIVSLSFALNITLSRLAHHTLFLGDMGECWECVKRPDGSTFDGEKFNFYVHAPSRSDPSTCPDGHDAITVLVPVPPLPLAAAGAAEGEAAQAQEEALVREVRVAVMRRLEEMSQLAPGTLAGYVVAELARTPLTWRAEVGLFRGQAFGLAHNLLQLSLLRPRLRHPRVGNLFRVGASTRPGNGVPLVMEGARLTAEAVARGFEMQREEESKNILGV